MERTQQVYFRPLNMGSSGVSPCDTGHFHFLILLYTKWPPEPANELVLLCFSIFNPERVNTFLIRCVTDCSTLVRFMKVPLGYYRAIHL